MTTGLFFSFICEFFTSFLTRRCLLIRCSPKQKSSVSYKTRNYCGCGLSTVLAFDAHHTWGLSTILTPKGKAKKRINLQTSSIHRKNPGVYVVLACSWIGGSQAFITQTGLVSSSQKYKDVSPHCWGSKRIFLRSILSTSVMSSTRNTWANGDRTLELNIQLAWSYM